MEVLLYKIFIYEKVIKKAESTSLCVFLKTYIETRKLDYIDIKRLSLFYIIWGFFSPFHLSQFSKYYTINVQYFNVRKYNDRKVIKLLNYIS